MICILITETLQKYYSKTACLWVMRGEAVRRYLWIKRNVQVVYWHKLYTVRLWLALQFVAGLHHHVNNNPAL